MFGHDVYAGRVSDEDYAVGELLGQQVQVKHGTVWIDDEF